MKKPYLLMIMALSFIFLACDMMSDWWPETVLPPPIISTAFLHDGATSRPYAQALVAEGTAPIVWSLVNGRLPPGLTLAKTGWILGVPTEAGIFHFTLGATNDGGTATNPFIINIDASAVAPKIISTVVPNGEVGVWYERTLWATGTAPITWSLQSGSTLPDGLNLLPNGTILGTPTEFGTFNFTVQAANGTTPNATQALSMFIFPHTEVPKITTASLPDGKRWEIYYELLAAGSAAIWTIESGSLPPGLVLSKNGIIGGIPAARGTYTFTVKAENVKGKDTKTFTIFVDHNGTFQVVFNSNGGTPVDTIRRIASGSTIPKPTDPTNTAPVAKNHLRGWYTDNGTFANEFDFSTPIVEDITLHADWGYRPGDLGPADGFIFYRKDSGFTVNGYPSANNKTYEFPSYTAFYLEVAPKNWQGTGDESYSWQLSPYFSNLLGTTGSIGDGRRNTARINDAQANTLAAYHAWDYNGGSKEDWFLPNDSESYELYKFSAAKGGNFEGLSGVFWTSRESTSTTNGRYERAYYINFDTGGLNTQTKHTTYKIRPIRAF